jgi:hypothetical protein
VLLQVVVGTDGKAREMKVIRDLGLGLDENGIAGVGAWESLVNVQVRIEVSFGRD